MAARPPSTVYRFRKLVRRHQTASVAVMAIMAAFVVTFVISTWSLARERAGRARERQALERADQRLRAATKFIKKVAKNVAPQFSDLPGAAPAQETLVNASLEFINDLSTGGVDDAEFRRAIAEVLYYYCETQSYGDANTRGNIESGLQRGREAVALLSKEPPEHLPAREPGDAVPLAQDHREPARYKRQVRRGHERNREGRVGARFMGA